MSEEGKETSLQEVRSGSLTCRDWTVTDCGDMTVIDLERTSMDVAREVTVLE